MNQLYKNIYNNPNPRPRPAPGWLARFIFPAICVSLGVGLSAAVPTFLPATDNTVLESLPLKPTDAGTSQLREQRRAWQKDPLNLIPALSLGRNLAGRAASEADPRYLGQAEAVLAPWWGSPTAPPEVLLLRGQIEQSRHDFEPAIATLKRAIQLDPRDPRGWLALASVYTVRGRYAEAKSCCFRLASLADEATVAGAMAGVLSMTGGAEPALNTLEKVLQRIEDGTDADLVSRRLWCETLAGEIAERLGRTAAAEAHYRKALSCRVSDPYALGAYADFLLDSGRPKEVLPLLAGYRRCDALLQRHAEAQISLEKNGGSTEAIETLTARFAELAARGERVHRREEARFQLRLLRHPVEAARLAFENWEVQREAADVRLLFETSRAAGEARGQQMALDWVRTNHLQDVIFEKLMIHGEAAQ